MSPCEGCHAGCCRSFDVPISGADIIRIERKLGLSFWDFVCRWADPDDQIARNYAPHFYFRDQPGTPFTICLLHHDSHFFPGTTKCRFLIECAPDAEHPRGVARCGIYADRPAACRAFPTKLNSAGDLAVIYDIPSKGRVTEGDDDSLYELCPRPWEPSDFDALTTVQDLVVAKYEMAFFSQLAEVWNRKPRAWNVFAEFLHTVYSSRVVCESVTEQGHVEPQATIRLHTAHSHVSTKAA